MLLFSIVFSFIGIWTDVAFIPKSNQNSYIYGRILWGCINIIILFNLMVCKKNVKQLIIPYLVTMMMYSMHGQWFVPCYYLGFVEILFIVGLFFPINKNIFKYIAICSGVLMCIIIKYSPATYASELLLDQKFRYDAIMAVFIITTGSLVGHKYITLKRQEKDNAYRKFLDIGKYSSFLLHDFKGLLTTPIFYADMLQQTLKSGLDNEKIINKLNEDLCFVQEYAKEIMKLTLPDSSEYNETERIDIDKIKKTLNILLRKPLNNIKLSINVNSIPSQKMDTFKLIKVLYNATMNSIESLNNSKISNPEITITFDTNKILIKDNGLGFPEKIIKKINNEEIMASSKENGSGIGTAIIKDIIKNMNGTVKFYNNNGAIVDIYFS